MGCIATIPFAPPVGAHLSFYWTMDEAGAANKADSTVGLVWPLIAGTLAAPGLFNNGTHIDGNIAGHGLLLAPTTAIQITQAVSKGISIWFWAKINAYAAAGEFTFFDLDTDDIHHTNQFFLNCGFANPAGFELRHTNDTNQVFVDTPNVTWALGSWHMVACTYDKTAQTINVYLDGALSATIADTLIYPDLTTTDFIFRRQSGGLAGPEDVTIDEFGLCLNGPLSPAQVTGLFNNGAGMTWPTVTTIVPYP